MLAGTVIRTVLRVWLAIGTVGGEVLDIRIPINTIPNLEKAIPKYQFTLNNCQKCMWT